MMFLLLTKYRGFRFSSFRGVAMTSFLRRTDGRMDGRTDGRRMDGMTQLLDLLPPSATQVKMSTISLADFFYFNIAEVINAIAF